jgi:hypothetical protein
MTKAFVDTTVLTDALLKTGEANKIALNAIKSFDITELPVYAIKEFKAGPLQKYVWLHNKCFTLGSFDKVLEAIQKMWARPRYMSTAMESLSGAMHSIGRQTLEDLSKKYGKQADINIMQCDEIRLQLKVVIMRSWKKRRKLTTDIVNPLPCYKEVQPYEKRGLIELSPTKCDPKGECYLAHLLKGTPDDLEKLRDSIKDSIKPENVRRSKVLRNLYRTPKKPMDETDCKNLGDAVFVFFAPQNSMILTTNISDFEPMAKSLGKSTINPKDIPL